MNPPFSGRAADVNDVFEVVEPTHGHIPADFDLSWLKAGLWRSRWLLLGGAAIGLAIGIGTAMLTTPIYQASATLQIDSEAPQVLGTGADSANASKDASAEDYLETQVTILTSRSIMERVARSLNYMSDPKVFRLMGQEAPAAQPGSEGYRRAVLGLLSQNLSVALVPGTRLVSVSFKSPDAVLAKDVANAIGTQFIEATLQRRFSTSDYSRKFLQDQIDKTRVQLEQSERALITFSQQAGITSVGGQAEDGGAKSSLTDANLTALNQAYAKARTDRVLAEQRWAAATNTPLLSIPEVVANGTVLQMQSLRAQKVSDLEGERQRHSETYPTVIKLKAEIAATDIQIESAAKRIRAAIREQFEIARQQEDSLAQNVGELRKASVDEQGRGVQLSILRRDADTNRALYDALLQRFRELNAVAGVTINNVSVIDPAETPQSPVWPKPAFNALLGALAGLLVGALVALLRERLDDSLRAPDDVERKFGLPLIGLLPKSDEGKLQEDLADPGSSLSESIYSIRTSLRLATAHGVPRTLAITSTQQGEGKSTTSIALARELAQSGLRTLLLDSDLRRPSVHAVFGFKNAEGFSNYLTGHRPVESLIHSADVPNLSIMTSGPLPVSAPRLLTEAVLLPAIEELQSRFDVIVLDCPPVLGLADALQLSHCAEATLFVHEAGKASQRQARSAMRRLERGGANLIGVVLTKFDFSRVGYSSYGYSQYYYAYSSKDQVERS